MEYKNLIIDFTERTKMNLTYIEEMVNKNPALGIYEITQLINSLLGLLVFPFEEYKRENLIIPDKTIDTMEAEGWKVPKVVGDFPQVQDLKELIRYLRNSVAHFNIKFLTDENQQISGLKVWNINPKTEIMYWNAELSVSDLRDNVFRFIDLILDHKNKLD